MLLPLGLIWLVLDYRPPPSHPLYVPIYPLRPPRLSIPGATYLPYYPTYLFFFFFSDRGGSIAQGIDMLI